MSDAAPDEVRRRLAALRRDIEAACAGCATVSVTDLAEARVVEVEPTAPYALGFSWSEVGAPSVEALVLTAGHHGGRWELEATADDVDFVAQVARAVIAGRVVETFGPGRSRVEITLLGGQTLTETG